MPPTITRLRCVCTFLIHPVSSLSLSWRRFAWHMQASVFPQWTFSNIHCTVVCWFSANGRASVQVQCLCNHACNAQANIFFGANTASNCAATMHSCWIAFLEQNCVSSCFAVRSSLAVLARQTAPLRGSRLPDQCDVRALPGASLGGALTAGAVLCSNPHTWELVST